MTLKKLAIINRIELLSSRSSKDNSKIIKKLERKLRKEEQNAKINLLAIG